MVQGYSLNIKYKYKLWYNVWDIKINFMENVEI
jgi:hypothetical protein